MRTRLGILLVEAQHQPLLGRELPPGCLRFQPCHQRVNGLRHLASVRRHERRESLLQRCFPAAMHAVRVESITRQFVTRHHVRRFRLSSMGTSTDSDLNAAKAVHEDDACKHIGTLTLLQQHLKLPHHGVQFVMLRSAVRITAHLSAELPVLATKADMASPTTSRSSGVAYGAQRAASVAFSVSHPGCGSDCPNERLLQLPMLGSWAGDLDVNIRMGRRVLRHICTACPAHLKDLHKLLVGDKAAQRLEVRQCKRHLRLVVVVFVHLPD